MTADPRPAMDDGDRHSGRLSGAGERSLREDAQTQGVRAIRGSAADAGPVAVIRCTIPPLSDLADGTVESSDFS